MKVFLSYRRDDTAGYVGHLSEDLAARFGPGGVFRDLDSIAPGRDFARVIDEAIAGADAVLVVIGRAWLAAGPEGRRRIDDEYDFVRTEVAAALARNTLVVPVLVGGARMPAAGDLPAPIRSLARHNATEVSDSRWDYDVGRLMDALDPESPAAVKSETGTGGGTGPGEGRGRGRHRRTTVTGIAAAVVVAGLLAAIALSDRGSEGGGDGAASAASPASTDGGVSTDAVAGRWSGTAPDGQGGTVRVTFDVATGCGFGDPCGTVEALTSTIACFGDLALNGLSTDSYEFEIVRLRPGSGTGCEPGTGYRLRPQGDDQVTFVAPDNGSMTLTRIG